jgi:CRP/FNR family transcriptional regulator
MPTSESTALAARRSRLGALPDDLLEEVIADATEVHLTPPGILHAESGPPFTCLVTEGLVRTVVSSPEGRQATIRYAAPGALLGVSSLFSDQRIVVSGVPLRASTVVMLRPKLLRDLAMREPLVAASLMGELADRVMDYQAELLGSTFASLRQKVARHLLEMALPCEDRGRLIAPVTQTELADAVGTSREVVVRILRDLREAGLVETGRDGIVLAEPERLIKEGQHGMS